MSGSRLIFSALGPCGVRTENIVVVSLSLSSSSPSYTKAPRNAVCTANPAPRSSRVILLLLPRVRAVTGYKKARCLSPVLIMSRRVNHELRHRRRRHRTADVLSPPRELRSVQPFDSNLYTIIKIIIQRQYLYVGVGDGGRGNTEYRNIVPV